MKETLTCSSCRSSWKREKTRGRKPVLCPKCVKADGLVQKPIQNNKPVKTKPKQVKLQNKIVKTEPKLDVTLSDVNSENTHFDIKAVYKAFYPKVQDKQLENQKSGSQWKCPSCGYVLKVYIPISDIPVHKCTPDMVSTKELKRIS